MKSAIISVVQKFWRSQVALALTAMGVLGLAATLGLVVGLAKPRPVTHAPQPQAAAVRITNAGFSPSSLIIKAGREVEWENEDQGALHWVEADPYPNPEPTDLSSGRLLEDMDYSYKFTKPGTYHYHDRLNPTITATVVVQP